MHDGVKQVLWSCFAVAASRPMNKNKKQQKQIWLTLSRAICLQLMWEFVPPSSSLACILSLDSLVLGVKKKKKLHPLCKPSLCYSAFCVGYQNQSDSVTSPDIPTSKILVYKSTEGFVKKCCENSMSACDLKHCQYNPLEQRLGLFQWTQPVRHSLFGNTFMYPCAVSSGG